MPSLGLCELYWSEATSVFLKLLYPFVPYSFFVTSFVVLLAWTWPFSLAFSFWFIMLIIFFVILSLLFANFIVVYIYFMKYVQICWPTTQPCKPHIFTVHISGTYWCSLIDCYSFPYRGANDVHLRTARSEPPTRPFAGQHKSFGRQQSFWVAYLNSQ